MASDLVAGQGGSRVSETVKKIAIFCTLAAVALALALGAAACSQDTVGAVTDNQGREVQLDGIPERIVSHVPSITETLFALGLGDSIVGVSDYCDYPEEAKEKEIVGGYYTPSIEKIAALDPDLVLTDGYAADIEKLDALGIPYMVLEPQDFDGLLANIELLGRITGTEGEAGDLVGEIEERIEAVVAAVADAPRPRVFYVFDATELSKPWTVGPGSFIDGLILLAGGENVAAQSGEPWLQFSIEALVDVDPELILVDTSMGTAMVSLEELRQAAGWKGTTAISTGRMSTIDGDLINRHGPRLVEGLEEMARIFHPGLFD
jgi:iron complex transport system substrate-binding protein